MRPDSIVDRLIKNMGNMHELGRQRAFELGNPFYAKFKEDGEYWRKEMPNGEKYLVSIEVIFDAHDMPVDVRDTIIKKARRFVKKPELIIVAGCNAAGKSTFIRTRLNELERFEILTGIEANL